MGDWGDIATELLRTHRYDVEITIIEQAIEDKGVNDMVQIEKLGPIPDEYLMMDIVNSIIERSYRYSGT